MAKSVLNKHFRLAKSTKRYLSTISDAHLRGEVCRAFALAQYEASIVPSKRREERPQAKDSVTGMLVAE